MIRSWFVLSNPKHPCISIKADQFAKNNDKKERKLIIFNQKSLELADCD